MHDVELVLPLVELGQHLQVQVRGEIRQLFAAEPGAQGLAVRLQHRIRLRRLGGEQGHVVTLGHQTITEGRDDPLGPAVGARRHGLVERSDLRDPHGRTGFERAAGRAGSLLDAVRGGSSTANRCPMRAR